MQERTPSEEAEHPFDRGADLQGSYREVLPEENFSLQTSAVGGVQRRRGPGMKALVRRTYSS